MRTILVTGGAGFIGSNFCHYWNKAYPDDLIWVLDALTYAGNRANLDGAKVKFIHGVVSQIEWCMDCEGVIPDLIVRFAAESHGVIPDLIVHFAAESHVDNSIKSAIPFVRTNVMGTQAVIDYALKRNIRLHHVSTDEVYGSLGPNDPPFTEESRYNPTSPYAASKAASDHLVRAAVKTHGLKATISHGCNTFGPRQHAEKLIPTLIRSNPMPLYGDGTNRRQWIYVEDHCRAIDLIIAKGDIGESYNVGGIELSNLDIAAWIAKPIVYVEDRPAHDFRYAMNDSKLRNLGWNRKWGFEGAMKETRTWYECRPSA